MAIAKILQKGALIVGGCSACILLGEGSNFVILGDLNDAMLLMTQISALTFAVSVVVGLSAYCSERCIPPPVPLIDSEDEENGNEPSALYSTSSHCSRIATPYTIDSPSSFPSNPSGCLYESDDKKKKPIA